MAVPTEVLWERDPHTAAKHLLLRRYLDAWFPIMSKQFRDVGITFLDGFAGPGEYTNASESSPTIATAQAMRDDVTRWGTQTRLVFIEERRGRAQHLRDHLSGHFPQSVRPPGLITRVHHGECTNLYEGAIEELGGWAGPVFANLDGWGADVDYRIVERIAQQRSSEVLVTFRDQFFVRFVDGEQAAGERVFGHADWRDVGKLSTPEKKPFQLDLYRQSLLAAGFDHVLTFEIIDEGGHSLHQFFGTNSDVAVRKFKDGLWEVDGVTGQRFRDPRYPNQLAFDILEPDLRPLEDSILGLLEERECSLTDLRRHALLETIYKETHAKTAVDELVAKGTAEQASTGRSHEDRIFRRLHRLF